MTKIYQYIIWFALYSTIGWIYEVFLEVVVYHWGFTNRGVLFGPYCPVYGFGTLIFILFVYPLIRDRAFRDKLKYIPCVFLLCMVLATGLELVTSYILEFAAGSWPWQTYANYRYNFQGRIALSPSIRFGLGGLLFLYLLQPLFERLCDKLGDTWVRKIARGFAAIFFADCVCTFFLQRLL